MKMKNDGNPHIKVASKLLHEQEFVKKTPTGTPGLDEITNGGIPTGRNTLVCGGPGSG